MNAIFVLSWEITSFLLLVSLTYSICLLAMESFKWFPFITLITAPLNLYLHAYPCFLTLAAVCSHPGRFFWFVFVLFCFLGMYLQHVEVPRRGVKLELQLLAYATATWDPSLVYDLHRSSLWCRILNPLSGARDQTCVLMDISQVLLSHKENSTLGVLKK